jgi:hypothetical protein
MFDDLDQVGIQRKTIAFDTRELKVSRSEVARWLARSSSTSALALRAMTAGTVPTIYNLAVVESFGGDFNATQYLRFGKTGLWAARK